MIRLILLIALTLNIKSDQLQQEGNTLFYVGDPMCSWCYGFGPEITKVKAVLPENVDFQIVMGGLRPYGEETMKELSSFLKEHWMEIHERTDQPFSYDILQQYNFIYDTEPACRAVVTAEAMDAEKAFPFFKAIQSAFYAKNKDTRDVNTYLEIAATLDMDSETFKKLFQSKEMKEATSQDFQMAAQFGINSFPSLVLKKGTEYHLVARGYTEAASVLEAINKVMK